MLLLPLENHKNARQTSAGDPGEGLQERAGLLPVDPDKPPTPSRQADSEGLSSKAFRPIVLQRQKVIKSLLALPDYAALSHLIPTSPQPGGREESKPGPLPI